MRLWADSVMVALLGSTPLYDRLRTIVYTLQHPSRPKSVSGAPLSMPTVLARRRAMGIRHVTQPTRITEWPVLLASWRGGGGRGVRELPDLARQASAIMKTTVCIAASSVPAAKN